MSERFILCPLISISLISDTNVAAHYFRFLAHEHFKGFQSVLLTKKGTANYHQELLPSFKWRAATAARYYCLLELTAESFLTRAAVSFFKEVSTSSGVW